MNLRRYEPWTLVNLLHRDLDRIAGRHFGLTDEADEDGRAVADWAPPVDVIEEKDRFVLRADVPGVSPDDIEISMEGGVLSIAGRREQEKTEEADGVRRVERVSGRFYRRFTLPDTADTENVAAKCVHGILEVTVPKQPQVLPRRITVEAG
jgi:HSP20 family protein